ncbi:MAG: phosphoglycolate phosphatase [Thermoplasmata archaeon]
MYSALFVDIDGTITDAKRRAECNAIEVLRKLEAKLIVVLTSGNVLPVVYGIRQFIGLSGPIIAENGGVVLYNNQIELLGKIDEVEKCFRSIADKIKTERIFTDRWRLTEIALKPDVEYSHLMELCRTWNVKIERTGFAVHIMPENVSKANAMLFVCRKLGLEPSACIAIGDGDNDAEMLSIAGWSGAPANASELAKQNAKYVAKECYGKGFLEIIEWTGLI